MSEIVKRFTTTYDKQGKHRKKCWVCGKLIDNGTPVEMRQVKTEKYYPVKGTMHFVKWQARHIICTS